MKFSDIQQATRDGEWECNYDLKRFVGQIKEWESEGLQMNPDFQRGHVWNAGQSRRFIEALLSGRAKNARTIYLNNPGWGSDYKGDFVCVDGLQRFTAIRLFMQNKIDIFSKNEINEGYFYKDYSDNIRILHTMKINVNNLSTKKEVLKWYLDINTGGVVHSDEEIKRINEMIESL